MQRAFLIVAALPLALLAPHASASPVGDCMSASLDMGGGLFGPLLAIGNQIVVEVGASSGTTGPVVGIAIDPVACGGGTDPLGAPVTHAAGNQAPTLPPIPLLS